MRRFGVLNLLVVIVLVTPSSTIDCRNPPSRIDWKACCPHKDIISDSIQSKCEESLGFNHRKSNHKLIPDACLLDCYLRSTGLVNGYSVDWVQLNRYLRALLTGTPNVLPVMATAIYECTEKLKKLHENMAKNPPNFPPISEGDCKGCAGVLLHCIRMDTIFNCPEDLWKSDDEGCNAHKKFYTTCLPPMRPHLH